MILKPMLLVLVSLLLLLNTQEAAGNVSVTIPKKSLVQPAPPLSKPVPAPPLPPSPPVKKPTPSPPAKISPPPSPVYNKPVLPPPSPPVKKPTPPPSPPAKVPPSPPTYKPAPPTPVKPSPPPPPRPRTTKDCIPLCEVRCKLHSRKKICLRACVACCDRCKCVPPGQYGQKEKCGACYVNMKTHGGRPKCP